MAQLWGRCTPTALAVSGCSQPWRPEKVRTVHCSTSILRPPWQVLWCPRSSAGQAAGLPFTLGCASTWSSPTTVNLLPQGLSMTWGKDHGGNNSTGREICCQCLILGMSEYNIICVCICSINYIFCIRIHTCNGWGLFSMLSNEARPTLVQSPNF